MRIFHQGKENHPYDINAIIILPDHLHCILTLPLDDMDFSTRWSLIKSNFSLSIETGERISKSRGEQGIWQRLFWDHLIRDESDYQAHIDYIPWNPVKHGLVRYVKDWRYSTFHQFVETGIYPLNWGNGIVCFG